MKEKEGINYDRIIYFTGCIGTYRTAHRPVSRSWTVRIWRHCSSSDCDLLRS